MNIRDVRSRVTKLESHKRWSKRPDHMLLIWYAEGSDPAEAVRKSRGLFGFGDVVGVAPWFDIDVPPPRWLSEYPQDLSDEELDCVCRHLTEMAKADGATDAEIKAATVEYQRGKIDAKIPSARRFYSALGFDLSRL